jgi:acetyl esterase/lipase
MVKRLVSLLLLGAICLLPCSQLVVAVHAAQPATPAAAVSRENDVIYGTVDGHDLILDVALPAGEARTRPAVVLIHGGAMMFADRSDLRPHADALAAAGYVTFNVDYRLVTETGENPWPAQLDDAQRAVRWVRAHAAEFGVDPERICAYGHSAGGVLAAQLGTRETRDNSDPDLANYSSKVACVVDIAGEMDLSIPTIMSDGEAIQTVLLGGGPGEAAAAYRDISPITHVTPASAPFLMLHGADDVIVGVEHSRRMTEALHQAGVEVVYAEYPVADHFIWLDWNQSAALTLAFLARHLGDDA